MAALFAITVVPSFVVVLLLSTFNVPAKSFAPFKTNLPGPVLVKVNEALPLMLFEIVNVALVLFTAMVELAVNIIPILPSLRVILVAVPNVPPFRVTWLALNETGGWLSDNGPVMNNAPPLMVVTPE